MRHGTLCLRTSPSGRSKFRLRFSESAVLRSTLYCIIWAFMPSGPSPLGAAEVGREEEEEEALVLFDASAAAKRFLVETFVLRPSHLRVRA